MNGPKSNVQSPMSGQKFSQKLVSQEPVYDRKMKVHRPRKLATKKPKWM